MTDALLQVIGKYANQMTEVSEEDSKSFLEVAKECLANDQSHALKEAVLDEVNKNFIHTISWDLLSTLGAHLVERSTEADANLDCVVILERIAEVGKPKEIFIGLLEQLDRFLDSAVARLFFRPLQTVLKKFGSSKNLYLDQALEQLHACVEAIPLPQYDGLDEKQKRLLIQDEGYQRLEETCVDLVEFVAPFVSEIIEKIGRTDEESVRGKKEFRTTVAIRREIEKYLIRLLEYPLAFIEADYRAEDKTVYESAFCICAKQILTYLGEMGCSFNSLFEYTPGASDSDELETDQRELSMLGISNLAYMVHSAGLSTSRVPAIYSADYLLALHRVHVAALMKKTEEPALSKGLDLLDTLIGQMADLSLSSSLLLDDTYVKIPETLITVMVMHSSEGMRKKAVTVFPVYINKFDWKGRYRLLTVLLASAEHSGVKGLLIGLIKDYVHQTLQNEVSNQWFVDSHLGKIFPSIFRLPNGSQTDLLEESDKIIAALNFLRYLLLRDPRAVNRTGVWSVVDQIDKGYLSELVTGLELSRLHYKQREEELLDEKKRAKRAKESDAVSVSVGGQEIGKMPYEQQMQVLTSAQFTFDLMQSLLGRVNEILSAQSSR